MTLQNVTVYIKAFPSNGVRRGCLSNNASVTISAVVIKL